MSTEQKLSNPPKRLLSKAQLAQTLGVSSTRIEYHLTTGRLHPTGIDGVGRVFFDVAELENIRAVILSTSANTQPATC